MMINAVLLATALILGYVVSVGLLMAATFMITSRAPRFVVKEYRIRKRYKLVEAIAWLACATAGGYVMATVAGKAHAWLSVMLLAAALILVAWTNSWEMRQRGIVYQLGITLLSVAGVALGLMLRLK